MPSSPLSLFWMAGWLALVCHNGEHQCQFVPYHTSIHIQRHNKTMKQIHWFPFYLVRSRWYENGFCLIQIFSLLFQRVKADCCDHIAISSNSHGNFAQWKKIQFLNPFLRKRLSGTPAWCLFKGDIEGGGEICRFGKLAMKINRFLV